MVAAKVAGDDRSTTSTNDNKDATTSNNNQNKVDNASKIDTVQDDVQAMLESDLTCPICADIYINPLILNCSHSFCKFCVYQWLSKKTACPQCRLQVSFQAENRALRDIINKMVSKTSQQFQTNRSKNVVQRLKEEEKLESNGTQNLMPWVKINNISSYNTRPRTNRYRLVRADQPNSEMTTRSVLFSDSRSGRPGINIRIDREDWANSDDDDDEDFESLEAEIDSNEDDDDEYNAVDNNEERNSRDMPVSRMYTGTWSNLSDLFNEIDDESDEDWDVRIEEDNDDSESSNDTYEIDVLDDDDDDDDTDMDVALQSSDDNTSDDDGSVVYEVDDDGEEDENPYYSSSSDSPSSDSDDPSLQPLDGTINIGDDTIMISDDSSDDPDYGDTDGEETDRYDDTDTTIEYATSDESDTDY